MNINTELFKKTRPKNKLAIVKNATMEELLGLTVESIKRMVKEAGTGITTKELHIDSEMAHNDRNSHVCKVYMGSKRNTYYYSVYVQGYDTDRVVSVPIEEFQDNRLVASFEEEYLTSPKTIVHAYYEPQDKARVYKAVCIAYIENKYRDKLVNED